mmetsp:Transcript_18030/g.23915  ORF Transcript_18030/g.23915 Transcript_18030/m.23915 type:complete len:142 (+) Transcript_18030:683-1108(+)
MSSKSPFHQHYVVNDHIYYLFRMLMQYNHFCSTTSTVSLPEEDHSIEGKRRRRSSALLDDIFSPNCRPICGLGLMQTLPFKQNPSGCELDIPSNRSLIPLSFGNQHSRDSWTYEALLFINLSYKAFHPSSHNIHLGLSGKV